MHPCLPSFLSDIAGFTAWSSTREPKQVFVLLETIYQAFDKLANQRKVFKVETIGDCYGKLEILVHVRHGDEETTLWFDNPTYQHSHASSVATSIFIVAVCGLPEPCDTHALNMAKFARDCMEKMNSLVHRLEPKLG